MNVAGPFYKAPILKALIFATGGVALFGGTSSLASKVGVSLSTGTKELWRIIPSQFVFSGTGDLLISIYLLYRFRTFERLMGTAKFAGFCSSSFIISVLTQLTFLVLFKRINLSSGMHWLIYSLLVQYYFDFPALNRFKLLKVPMSEKAFTYLIGCQLLFSQGMSSLLPGLAGIVAGFVYRLDFLGLQNLKAPNWLRSFCHRFIEPMLLIYDPEVAEERRRALRERQRDALARMGVHPRVRSISDGDGVTQGYTETLVPDEQYIEFQRAAMQGFGQWANAGPTFGQRQRGERERRGAASQEAAIATPQAPPPVEVSEEAVHQLLMMGFDEESSRRALQRSSNNVEMAIASLLS